jgi:hypothetical protein
MMDAKLRLRLIKLQAETQIGIEKTILNNNIVYPFIESKIQTYGIAKGLRNFKADNLFFSSIPQDICIALVSQSAFAGSVSKNPYNFANYNLCEVGVTFNNMHIQGSPIRCDYNAGDWTMAYRQMLEGTNHLNGIKINDFNNGKAIYYFKLSDLQTRLMEAPTGMLRLELCFKEALSDEVTLIVYGRFNKQIKINAARQVSISY